MSDNIKDIIRKFLSPEAGQKRRQWLDGNLSAADGAIRHFLGPTGIPDKLSAVSDALNYTDAGDMTEAADASREFWDDPSFRGGVRLGTAGAAMAIPFVGARMLNDGVDVVGDALRSGGDDVSRFAADESGAVGLTRTGDDVMVDVTVNNEGNGLYSVFADGAPAGEVRIASNGAGDFVERSQLNPEFQGKRIGHQAYNLIERDMGKRLVPSPTGLSANGAAFWRRRIKDYEPDEAVDAYKRSQAAGRGYGIPDRDINMRLYGVGGSDALDAISPALSPAQQQAQEVLGLLQSGRGADVTDDMLAAADDMYLFDNYDLPMDEASRMARAQDMGFDVDTPLYHGTGAEFQGYRDARRGNYFSDNPEIADIYASGSTGGSASIRGQVANAGPNIQPVMLGGNEVRVSDVGPDGGHGWSTDNISKQVEGVDKFPLGTYPTRLNEAAQREGFDRLRIDDMLDLGGEQTQWMSLDPSNIRSRFARFDPRLAHLRNLSAGIGGAAALGPYAGDLNQEERKRKIREYLQ